MRGQHVEEICLVYLLQQITCIMQGYIHVYGLLEIQQK